MRSILCRRKRKPGQTGIAISWVGLTCMGDFCLRVEKMNGRKDFKQHVGNVFMIKDAIRHELLKVPDSGT